MEMNNGRNVNIWVSYWTVRVTLKGKKGLAIDSFNKLKQIFNSKRINAITKFRMFNTFVSSIFLYSSEL